VALASRPEFFRFLPTDQPTRDEERAWLDSSSMKRMRCHAASTSSASKSSTVANSSGWSAWGSTPSGTGAPASVTASARSLGHGYATEAAQLIVGFGFEVLWLHRVWATHHPDNLASRKVLERVGLGEEGGAGRSVCRWRVVRLVVCSILEDEWRLRRTRS